MKATQIKPEQDVYGSGTGPTGGTGGDLGGTFPAPTVTGLQGTPICVTAPTVGQVLVFDGTEWCPAPPGGGGGTLPWFNVMDPIYGATGDGTTDDTAAINLAIAALVSAGCGVLYFPCGTYKTTAGLTALSVPCLVLGDGSAYGDGTLPVSEVTCTSGTANLFTCIASVVRFEKIALLNTAGTPSAGAGILASGADVSYRVDYENVLVSGFYINVNVTTGTQWVMHACILGNAVKYAMKIANTINGDAGDWSISDSWFGSVTHAADAAIRIESSGGGKITNVKINSATNLFVHGIDFHAVESTSVFQISNCSIENVSGDGIHGTTTSGKSFTLISVMGCEFGLYSNNTGKAMSLVATNTGEFAGIMWIGNTFVTDGTARTAVQITKCDIVVFDSGVGIGWTGLYTATTCTNVYDFSGGVALGVQIQGQPSTTGQVPTSTSTTEATWQTPVAAPSFATPAIVLGTAAAAGAASTVIRSDSTIVAFDTTAPENVANVGVASSAGSIAKAARRDHGHALTYHDEILTDGASNLIFDGGDTITVTGVPN